MARTNTASAGRAAAVVVALTCLVFVPSVALAQTDVSGTWEVSMTTPQGPTTVDVSMKQQGETITGELTSPLGVAPFTGTLKGDALTVVAPIDVQGTALVLTFTAKVTGSTLAGTVKFGDLGEAPFDGKRKPGAAAPAAAAAAAPVAAPASAGGSLNGNWNISINMQGNEIPATATFTQDGGKLTGTISSQQGEIPVSGTMTGNTLKLEFVAPGDMAITMTGTLGASGLAGKMSIAGLGDADWTGTRK